MDDKLLKQQELTTELKRARYWILGVGILMVVVDQIIFAASIPAGADPALVSEFRNKLFMIDGIVLAFFIAMFFLAKVKPVLGCVLALIGFWGIALWSASQEGGNIMQGIVVKIFFTLALIKGIKSASRAEQLQSELGKVFE